ncbi:MAG: cation transporter [Pseudomonadales bacterium]|jgi:Co/Zn/Cd efflux system component|tara:strand:+ start:8667 stop:9287 length:621 start_codon:yes stop_codon:yes gene_type:complete
MSGCCDNDSAANQLRENQRGTLIAVLAINATMFFVMVIAAQFAKSTALFADSLDNFGDAMTYALSLMVIASGIRAKAKVALFKGCLILLAGLVVLSQIGYKLLFPETPIFELMGFFSLVALVANALCLGLLWRHRNEDINMSSVWECSRNDIATNISVFVAAGAVWFFEAGWPDVIVASALVILLLQSSARVISSAIKELQPATEA